MHQPLIRSPIKRRKSKETLKGCLEQGRCGFADLTEKQCRTNKIVAAPPPLNALVR